MAKLGYYFVFVFANSNFCSNQTTLFHLCQTTPFRLYQTTLFLSQQQTATQQLIATNMFTFSTYLSLILCTFYQQPLQLFLISQPIPTTNRFVPRFNHFVTHFLFSFTTICFRNSTTTSISHFCYFLATIFNSFIAFSFILPEFFLFRLAIFMPSLQGEPCRGSSHPSSG